MQSKSEHAIVEAAEQATIERGAGRPTPKYIESVRGLLDSLKRSPTACEACGVSLATIVTGDSPMVICRGCSTKYSGPFRQHYLRLAAARRSGR